MAGVKKPEYIALTGIDLESGKRKQRIEAGEDLPSDVSEQDIKDLLEIRAIVLKGGNDE